MSRLSFIFLLFLTPQLLSAEVKELTNEQLSKLISTGVPIIDIRRKEEWSETGIIEGSHLSTFFDKNGKANVNEWLTGLNLLVQKDQPLILICRTGRRTGLVAKFLDEKIGYKKVYNVTSGIKKWIKGNNPIIPPT